MQQAIGFMLFREIEDSFPKQQTLTIITNRGPPRQFTHLTTCQG